MKRDSNDNYEISDATRDLHDIFLKCQELSSEDVVSVVYDCLVGYLGSKNTRLFLIKFLKGGVKHG